MVATDLMAAAADATFTTVQCNLDKAHNTRARVFPFQHQRALVCVCQYNFVSICTHCCVTMCIWVCSHVHVIRLLLQCVVSGQKW